MRRVVNVMLVGSLLGGVEGCGKGKGDDPRIAGCARAGLDASWWLVERMLGPDTTGSGSAYATFWRDTQQTAERAIDARAKSTCGRIHPNAARCIGDRKLDDEACENAAMEIRTIVVSGPACVEVARAALPVRWLATDAGGPGKLSPEAPWATQAEALRARIDGEALTAACGSGLSFGCLYLGRGSECAALDASLRPKS